MHFFVTGGAGFMGSNFIRHILRTYPDYHVTNFDKLTYAGNPKNLQDIVDDPLTSARYRFVQGDIADAEAVGTALDARSVDVLINYAAETHVDRSIHDPKAFLMTDVIGSYTLLEAVKARGIKKMVQISTDEVFGSIDEGEFTETSPFEPNSPYSAAKAGGDHLCRAYWETYRVPVVVTHSCNVYGPYHYPEKLIPLAITNLLDDKQVPVYGDGQQVREWIYVLDHARAIDVVAHEGVAGEIYNVGTGDRWANIDTVRELLRLIGAADDKISYVKDRPGHDRRYAISHDKLTRELGWQPQMGITDGLAETVRWFQEHRDWWEPIKSGEYLEYYNQQYGQQLDV
jgi:dTDP-glucose 4,6-dehydratase